MSGSWEHFHHDADIGVRGIGSTLVEAFEQTALAMTAVVAELDTISPVSCISIECEAPANDYLLMDWLNALVYEMAIRKMLFARFDVSIDAGKLVASACGESVDVDRHQPAVEIKGATLTGLSVSQQSDGRWLAQCIVDV